MIKIKKASGEEAVFDLDKLRRSLAATGANEFVVDEVLQIIEREAFEGMSSQLIYQKAFELLKRRNNVSAAKYRLKKALMDLGPSGYPFEYLVAQLFQLEGFETQVGIILPGQCVEHEVDVFAHKDHQIRIAECKFHNMVGTKSDVKVALYVQSRFQDLVARLSKQQNYKGHHFECWIATNTRFTDDAEKYANCMGMRLISWDYPAKYNLKTLIDQHNLYPLTCLTILSDAEKDYLLSKGLVLVRQLRKGEGRAELEGLHLSDARRSHLMEEMDALCYGLD
jgi:hypothetical protein